MRTLTLVAAAAFACQPAVFAHIQLTRSDPADGHVLDRPVRDLRLWFSQPPVVDKSKLEIGGPAGALDVSGLHTMGDNDLMARVAGQMPDGAYTVKWQSAGADDGHLRSGQFTFTIKRPAGAALATEATKPMSDPTKPLTLGVVLYPGFELLDVYGPLEMLSNVPPSRLRIVTIAEQAGPVASGAGANPGVFDGPRTIAAYDFSTAPELDLLLVPGGFGTLAQLNNEKLLAFLRARAAAAQITTSVCSGSAILARAGILDGHRATSNKRFFSLASSQSDKVEWVHAARWVDDGPVMTSSGVSAGTDMALALIARLFGEELAQGIADGTEYQWHRDASVDPFARFLDPQSATGRR